jgi:hypothetical protein
VLHAEPLDHALAELRDEELGSHEAGWLSTIVIGSATASRRAARFPLGGIADLDQDELVALLLDAAQLHLDRHGSGAATDLDIGLVRAAARQPFGRGIDVERRDALPEDVGVRLPQRDLARPGEEGAVLSPKISTISSNSAWVIRSRRWTRSRCSSVYGVTVRR